MACVALPMDLSARLAARGRDAEAMPNFHTLYQGPSALRSEEGSALVRSQMHDLAAAVLKHRTLAELREVCRLHGAPSQGSKDELLHQLLAMMRRRGDCTHSRCASSNAGECKRLAADVSIDNVVAQESTPKRRRRSFTKRCESPVVANSCLPEATSTAQIEHTSPTLPCSPASSKEQAPKRRRSMAKACESKSVDYFSQSAQAAQGGGSAFPAGEQVATQAPKRRRSVTKAPDSMRQ